MKFVVLLLLGLVAIASCTNVTYTFYLDSTCAAAVAAPFPIVASSCGVIAIVSNFDVNLTSTIGPNNNITTCSFATSDCSGPSQCDTAVAGTCRPYTQFGYKANIVEAATTSTGAAATGGTSTGAAATTSTGEHAVSTSSSTTAPHNATTGTSDANANSINFYVMIFSLLFGVSNNFVIM